MQSQISIIAIFDVADMDFLENSQIPYRSLFGCDHEDIDTATFWLSIISDSFPEPELNLYDEEHEGIFQFLALDTTNGPFVSTATEITSLANPCVDSGDLQDTPVSGSQAQDLSIWPENNELDKGKKQVEPRLQTLESTEQVSQGQFTSRNNVCADKAVEGSSGNISGFPLTVANAEDATSDIDDAINAGSCQRRYSVTSQNHKAKPNHDRMSAINPHIRSSNSERDNCMKLGSLISLETSQIVLREAYPLASRKRNASQSIRNGAKRRKVTVETTNDVIRHSQIILERDSEVFVRFTHGLVMLAGVATKGPVPIVWNRRGRVFEAETADDFWKSTKPSDFKWVTITLQVGGDGYAVTLIYEDDGALWVGWDAESEVTIALPAEIVEQILLRPGKSTCVAWKKYVHTTQVV
ncbi:hypothetical protein BKA67DRAFT_684212 [Truncatella angustata]|uniref:Uncharacterized protein n=1 Tax=Truncatella angustata TaxID=152316 RepID=A0A9P8RP69_9PEZI|nr:uncharacterized protein BKA67DRAFT_684212 [Truncatella angustata]KAH6646810.1 hypothetical protein BKA67DRAFT_684212 [Truncatella angustata]